MVDTFVVLVALPSIQDQLHASDAGVQLVVAGYGVAYAAFLIVGGRLGDIHGRRKLLVVGLALFMLASLWGAAAPNEEVLVLALVLVPLLAGERADVHREAAAPSPLRDEDGPFSSTVTPAAWAASARTVLKAAEAKYDPASERERARAA